MEKNKSESKKTLVVGATTNPARYAYFATKLFSDTGIEFIPIGIKKGQVFGKEILDLKTRPTLEGIHTITLYLGPSHQKEWMDYLISLKPKRIIFNPGAENHDFAQRANVAGIETLEACSLVMLRTGQF